MLQLPFQPNSLQVHAHTIAPRMSSMPTGRDFMAVINQLSQLLKCMALMLLIVANPVIAETRMVEPQGVFAEIDTRLAQEAIRALSGGNAQQQQSMIATVKANPNQYAPPVFFWVSHVLFENGAQDEGAFWFYVGQLRARIDANICTDVSARQAVSLLNEQFGPPINQYMFQDIPKLEAMIPEVVKWDQKTPYLYDRRWINLHGMQAMMASMEGSNKHADPLVISEPEAQWDAIAAQTRTDYLKGFTQAMVELKSRK